MLYLFETMILKVLGNMGTCGDGCTGPCSTRSEGELCSPVPKNTETPRVSLAEALARVVVDNRVAVRAVELYEAGITDMNDIVVQINLDKSNGTL